MKNYQKGSATLWVIIAAIIVVAIIGYVVYSRSNQSQSNSYATNNSVTQQGLSETPAVTNTKQASTFGCDQVFPYDIMDAAFPSAKFQASGRVSAVMQCSYGGGSLSQSGDFGQYIGMLLIYPYNAYIYSTNVKDAQSGTGPYKFTCSTGDIGSQSVMCSAVVSAYGQHQTVTEVIFVSSNHKYNAVVSITTPDSALDKQSIIEKMAKEADTKLSAL